MDPRGQRVHDLASDLGVRSPRSRRDMEGMIGLGEQAQGCELPEAFEQRLEPMQLRKSVARALDKEHRDSDLEEVVGALARRPAGRVQGKAEKSQAPNARKRRPGLRLRGHSAA